MESLLCKLGFHQRGISTAHIITEATIDKLPRNCVRCGKLLESSKEGLDNN